jgi:GT2 family glycosyltransferase
VGNATARGDVVCLFSAHGVAEPHYVAASVQALRESGASGVGGRYHHIGHGPTDSAIGLAMVSPFGMASPHRFATSRKEVDTISHPAYVADDLRSVGPFDEDLLRNSDYEMNWRLRRHGYRLEFDPSIESTYRPRPSLSALARQFWWYGRWKERVLRRAPGSMKPRHLVAPAAVAGVIASPLLMTSRWGRTILAVAAASYAGAAGWAVVHARPTRRGASPLVLAACFPTMHLAWGSGFLTSLVEDLLRPHSEGER